MGTCPISAETIKDMGERNCIMNILVRCLFLFVFFQRGAEAAVVPTWAAPSHRPKTHLRNHALPLEKQVGGVAEMFLLDDEREQVLMRRGFIREAIKNGIDIMYVCRIVGQTRARLREI